METLGDLKRSRRVRLIGILGAPNAGKTAALVSLYLLAAKGHLEGFEFRNSDSLLAFELLARGARKWDDNGSMMEELTLHTTLADPRRPGFLHLRLHQHANDATVDLAFPDLPGEWSEELITRSEYERLGFVQNADALWIVVDGETLSNENEGPWLTSKTSLLLDRIVAHLKPPADTPVLLVLTRMDTAPSPPEALLAKIRNKAQQLGLEMGVVQIASFSADPQNTPPGSGMAELLSKTIRYLDVRMAEPDIEPRDAERQMLNYRAFT